MEASANGQSGGSLKTLTHNSCTSLYSSRPSLRFVDQSKKACFGWISLASYAIGAKPYPGRQHGRRKSASAAAALANRTLQSSERIVNTISIVCPEKLSAAERNASQATVVTSWQTTSPDSDSFAHAIHAFEGIIETPYS